MKRFCIPAFLLASIAIACGTAPAQDAVPKAKPAKAEPTPAKATPTKAASVKPAKATPTVRPLSVTVGLVSDNEIEGTLTDTTQLQMQTSFGTASIPLTEVAGIRFASADDATTTVVMLNGDSITGATDVKLITVETEWGTASINGPSMSSIMFVPGLTWNPQSGLNGKRWSLSDVKKSAPPAPAPRSTATRSSAPTTNTRSRSTSAPSRSVPSSGSFQPGNSNFFPGN